MFIFGRKKNHGSGNGDMLKSVYDTDGDGIVDKCETVDDGTYQTTAGQVKTAYDRNHVQNADQYLDQGGVNQSSASDVKDAVDKKHSQNTDTILDSGGLNEVAAGQIKEAIDTTIPSKVDKVVSAVNGNFAGLNASGNLVDSGHKDSDYADANHSHDDLYLSKTNTTPFTPDADYEPATKKFVEDSISGAGGGDMLKATYDADNDGIVDKAETIDDGAGNSASASDAKDAVTKKHTQNTDQYLDFGGANQSTASNVKDAVDKKHTQNTDTNTSSNEFSIGDGTDTDKDLKFNNGDVNKPGFKYNHTTHKIQYANDGSTYYDLDSPSGSGDMNKAIYDQDEDGIVDKAETIDDGAGNSATASDTKDAVSKKHTQGTDQGLDTGGANAVTAAQAKAGYTHSTLVSGNPHSVSKGDVGLSNVPNSDTTDAINKAHTQNTDTGTSGNYFSVGDGLDTTKEFIANNADANKPKMRYNHITNNWEYTNDGITYQNFGVAEGGGAGTGDMSKSTYDQDSDGIVDKSESLDNGTTINLTAETVERNIYNTIVMGFKIAIHALLSIYKIINGVIDLYFDETGIDGVETSGQAYDEDGDFYAPSTTFADIVKLVLNMDGAIDGVTSTTDESQQTHSVSFNGNAQMDTALAPSGFTSSCLFDGVAGTYLGLGDHADWDFDADFTIEFFIRADTTQNNYVIGNCNQSAGSDGWYWFMPAGANATFAAMFSGSWTISISYAHGISSSTWTHVAIVRNGTSIKCYTGGIQKASSTNSPVTNITTANALRIGQAPVGTGYPATMSVAGLKITKEAVYTSEFTPPSAPFVGSNENMTLVSETQVAESQPTIGRICLLERDIDAITLNTDLFVYISRDDGITWSQVTLSDKGDFDSTRRILTGTVNLSSQPAGTNMRYKIVTDNLKSLQLYGTGFTWE